MNLVMFDIDGTLTSTNQVDHHCFCEAVCDVLSVTNIDSDWSHYTHVTDQGIAAEIVETHKGRPATNDELLRIENRFIECLQREVTHNTYFFQPIQGASEMLCILEHDPNVSLALATGGWHRSAILKLHTAGLDLHHLPMATANDALSRKEIMNISHEKARLAKNNVVFRSKVYTGDGIWDLHAARSLGYSFVGIGTGTQAQKLKSEGARYVIPDFNDTQRFLNILEKLWEKARENKSYLHTLSP